MNVTVYGDFNSLLSYLASQRADWLVRTATAEIDWRAVEHCRQAANAIAICTDSPVRADCLELSLRHPFDIGAYGGWGGLVEGERRALPRQWLTGTRVTEFL